MSEDSLRLPAGELQRVLRLAMGGTRGKSLVFPYVGFDTEERPGAKLDVRLQHTDEPGVAAVDLYLPTDGAAADWATNDPGRLLELLHVSFDDEEEVQTKVDGSVVRFVGESSSVQFPVIGMEKVPRLEADPVRRWLTPDGPVVCSHTVHGDAKDWASWTGKGYVRVVLKRKDLVDVVAKAETIAAKNANAVMSFTLEPSGCSVKVMPARDAKGELLFKKLKHEGLLGKHELFPSTVVLSKETAGPVLVGLKHSTAEDVTLVYRDKDGFSANFLLKEKDGLELTYTVAVREG